jgi:hypothetical protein
MAPGLCRPRGHAGKNRAKSIQIFREIFRLAPTRFNDARAPVAESGDNAVSGNGYFWKKRMN